MINIDLRIGSFSIYVTGGTARTGLDARTKSADGMWLVTSKVAKTVGSGGVD